MSTLPTPNQSPLGTARAPVALCTKCGSEHTFVQTVSEQQKRGCLSILLWLMLALLTFGLILLFPILRGSGSKTRTYRTCQSCGYRQLLKQPGLFGAPVVGLVAIGVLSGCSFQISTKPAGAQRQEGGESSSSSESADPHAAYVARQQAQQKAEQERWETEQRARKERDDENARQSECREELLQLRREQNLEAQVSREREALSSCPDSGISPGTYRTDSGMPHVELQVTEQGCAAYEAYSYHDGTDTRTYAAEHGLRQVEYGVRYECTVGGVLDENRAPSHARWAGNACLRKVLDIVAEGVSWSFTGTKVIATANEWRGKPKVTLVRVDQDASGWNDGSPLWKKLRTQSDDEARVSVAFTPIPPMPTGSEDWCFDLKVQQAARK